MFEMIEIETLTDTIINQILYQQNQKLRWKTNLSPIDVEFYFVDFS